MRELVADAPGAEFWIIHGAGQAGYLDVDPQGSSASLPASSTVR
jgi:hypothetical protein